METKKQTLSDIDNKVPFKVPENYFSQLNETSWPAYLKRGSRNSNVSMWTKQNHGFIWLQCF